MAGFDYNKMVSLADRLLEYFGGASKLTITYATSEVYNVATQTNVKVTSTYEAWGVVNPYDKTEIDGETIQQDDLRLFLQKSTQEPSIDDVVTFKGKDYRIMEVESRSPGGEDILYVCQLRL
jgi:hypothetical protein